MVVAKLKLPLFVSVRLSSLLFCKVTLRPELSPLSEPPIVALSPPPQPETPRIVSAPTRHGPAVDRIIHIHILPRRNRPRAILSRRSVSDLAIARRPASTGPGAPHEQGHEQCRRGRTGHERRCCKHLRQAVDGLDADLLHVVDEGDDVARTYVPHVLGPDAEVFPA